jgi:cell division septum initiation protein DivIVA
MESVRNRPGPVAPGTVTEVEVEMPPEKAKQAIAQARRQANEIVSAADTKAMETVEAANAEAAALLEKAGEEARGLVLEEARRIVAENPEEPESETTEE